MTEASEVLARIRVLARPAYREVERSAKYPKEYDVRYFSYSEMTHTKVETLHKHGWTFVHLETSDNTCRWVRRVYGYGPSARYAWT